MIARSFGMQSLSTYAERRAQPDVTATLTTSPTARCTGSPWLAPTTVALPIVSDASVAWMLADAADVGLTGYERTMTFVELGAGEDHLAIERILNVFLSCRMTLPVAVFDRMTRWLEGYAGSSEEPRLRTMLAEIWAKRFEPVPLHTEHAQRADSPHTAAAAGAVGVAS
jgi:hypothetical protein